MKKKECLKMNLKTIRKELRALSEKHPISDLWTRVFFLLDEYEAELRQMLIDFKRLQETAEGRCPFTKYDYKANGMNVYCPDCDAYHYNIIGLILEILGEEASEE